MSFIADREREEIEALNERIKEKENTPLLKRFLEAFGNMFALNLCFVITCIPIVTIGASVTALYAMCIRLQDGRESTVLHGFIENFKKNFKQATVAWGIILLCAAVMLAEYVMINNIPTSFNDFYTILLIIEAIVFLFTLPFVFPLISQYDNSIFNVFKNSFLLSVAYLGSWIKVLLAWIAPILISIIYPMVFIYTWYLWLLLIFGAIAWGSSYTIRHVFEISSAG